MHAAKPLTIVLYGVVNQVKKQQSSQMDGALSMFG